MCSGRYSAKVEARGFLHYLFYDIILFIINLAMGLWRSAPLFQYNCGKKMLAMSRRLMAAIDIGYVLLRPLQFIYSHSANEAVGGGKDDNHDGHAICTSTQHW